MELNNYDLIVINSSAGKDSLCSIWEVCRIAKEQNFSKRKIVVSHQDLGEAEWGGTKLLAEMQADLFGLISICLNVVTRLDMKKRYLNM